MIYDLLVFCGASQDFLDIISAGNVYFAFITSFILGFIFIPIVINIQRKNQLFQPIRDDGPQTHLSKPKTPTMGGLGILLSYFISAAVWVNSMNPYIWAVSIVTLGYGCLGFIDDFRKIKQQNTKGVSARGKLFIQFFIAIIATSIIYFSMDEGIRSAILFPLFKNFILDLGVIYLLFGSFVIVGASNSVNLTDGLDGLLVVPFMIAVGAFIAMAISVGDQNIAHSLNVFYIKGSKDIIIICAAMIGACFSFLWYNAHPASIFMGDTGSLSLGGFLASVSLILKQEILLAIIGGLFVIEALSVIIQVYYFKATGGKRFFKMAPIHHHFEKCGWAETQVVVRAWMFSFLLAAFGLILFYTR